MSAWAPHAQSTVWAEFVLGHALCGKTTACLGLLSDEPFSCLFPVACSSDWDVVGSWSIIQDPMAPMTPPGVAQITYPSGFVGGSAPASVYRAAGNTRVLLVSMWLKLSPNFQNHATGTNKLVHFFISGLNRLYLQARGSGLAPAAGLQQIAAPYDNGAGVTATAVNLMPNVVTSATLGRGQWHRLDVLLEANSPGVANGAVTLWLDGVKVLRYTGIMYAAAGTNARWEFIAWNPTWGGSGDVVAAPMYIQLDHVTVRVLP